MKTFSILSLCLYTASFSAMAGSAPGTDSWQPRVSPETCLIVKGPINGPLGWYNDSACVEVIEKGYAKGVEVSGRFRYQDGTALWFKTIILPHSTVQYNHNGRGIDGIDKVSASWLRN